MHPDRLVCAIVLVTPPHLGTGRHPQSRKASSGLGATWRSLDCSRGLCRFGSRRNCFEVNACWVKGCSQTSPTNYRSEDALRLYRPVSGKPMSVEVGQWEREGVVDADQSWDVPVEFLTEPFGNTTPRPVPPRTGRGLNGFRRTGAFGNVNP
jgi:hypothetical protein